VAAFVCWVQHLFLVTRRRRRRLVVALAFSAMIAGACCSSNASSGNHSAPQSGAVSEAHSTAGGQKSPNARSADSVPHGGIGKPAVATQTP
jgi:hypothetical protein